MQPFSIRQLKENDENEICSLSHQLGYKIEPQTVKNSIEQILQQQNHFCFVAISEDKIIGYIHAVRKIRLTSSPFLEIVALVVSENHRKKGVGKALIQEIHQLQLPNEKIRVRCQIKRKEAHLFYQKLGFEELKEQKVFEKK